MYYIKMLVGVVICAIGGWQLADVLDEGPGGGSSESSSFFSSSDYEWGEKCTRIARSAIGSGTVTETKVKRARLRLQQQGCNPDRAPAGTIPMVQEATSDHKEIANGNRPSNDWGDSNRSAVVDGWGQ